MPLRAARSPSPLRQLMLVLLVLATLCAPALSFAAEAHGRLAHPLAAGEDYAHGHGHEDAADEAGDGEAASPLHVAMHAAGCAGHACATLPAMPMHPPAAASVPAAGQPGPLAPDALPDRNLRPPISG